jgi:hypothetical protein
MYARGTFIVPLEMLGDTNHFAPTLRCAPRASAVRYRALNRCASISEAVLRKNFCATADQWNFGLCATIPRKPRQARKGATVAGQSRVPRSTRSSSHRIRKQGEANTITTFEISPTARAASAAKFSASPSLRKKFEKKSEMMTGNVERVVESFVARPRGKALGS